MNPYGTPPQYPQEYGSGYHQHPQGVPYPGQNVSRSGPFVMTVQPELIRSGPRDITRTQASFDLLHGLPNTSGNQPFPNTLVIQFLQLSR